MKWVVSSELLNKCLEKGIYSDEKLIKGYVLALLDSNPFSGKVAIVTGNNRKGLIGRELSLKLDNSDLFVTNDVKDLDNYKEKNIIVIDKNTSFDDYDIIVDGLLDNNLHGVIDNYNNMIIKKINNSHKKIISIDLNSGLNYDSGLGQHIVYSIPVPG